MTDSIPCRYNFAPNGCPYAKTCLFQHNMNNMQRIARSTAISVPIYGSDIEDIDHSDPPLFDINLLGSSLNSNTFPISSGSDDNYIDIKTDVNITESMETKWDIVPKYIPYGSRKNIEIERVEIERDALIINNCGDNKLNGLYISCGLRNGYIFYTECINGTATIYCNPNRGWSISYKTAIYYYSYPLTPYPPTINDCKRKNISWHNQGIINNELLPEIKSKSIMSGYDLLDLLMIGFIRFEKDKTYKIDIFTTSTDIIDIFCSYFIFYRDDLCQHCLGKCVNLVLCGFKWLCKECKTEAMD